MRIAYLVDLFPKISETFVLDEVKGHVRNGIEVTVFSFHRVPPGHPAWANLEGLNIPVVNIFEREGRVEKFKVILRALVRYPALAKVLFGRGYGPLYSRIKVLALAAKFENERRKHRFEILHCHFGTAGLVAAVLRRFGIIRVPFVTTFHGYDLSATLQRHGRDYYDLLFRYGDLFLPISEMWAKELRALGADPARIQVHRVGIACGRHRFSERRPEPGGRVKLITIGRMVEKKGHLITLRAMAELRKSRPDLNVSLDLVGDGPEEVTLREETEKLGLNDLVTFHGALPHAETLELLNHAAIFVLPSVTATDGDMEGIPVAIMEAMAQGMPVISTLHSGIPELVEQGRTGLLVPERDVSALAAAIERLVSQPATWPEYGRLGRQKVEAEFNRDALNAGLLEFYRRLSRAPIGDAVG